MEYTFSIRTVLFLETPFAYSQFILAKTLVENQFFHWEMLFKSNRKAYICFSGEVMSGCLYLLLFWKLYSL